MIKFIFFSIQSKYSYKANKLVEFLFGVSINVNVAFFKIKMVL